MKTIFQRRVLVTTLLLAMVSALHGLDFGLTIENSTAIQGHETLLFSQRDSAILWLSHDTEEHKILAEGFYQFQGDWSANGSSVIPYRFDIRNLYWEGRFSELLGADSGTLFRLGRQDFSDATGHIIGGKADGLYARHSFSTVELALMAYYTGLLAQSDANIIISQADFDAYSDPSTAPYFAPSKLVGGFRGRFLEIFSRHDLSLDIVAQFDLGSLNPLHTYYGQLVFEGRPLQWLKYRGYLIGELWGDAVASVSLAAGARIQMNFPELANLVVLTSFDWAGGADENFRQYIPVNQNKVAQIYPAAYSDVMAIGLNAITRPTLGFGIGLNGAVLFRATNNQPADPDFATGSLERYLGSEVLASLDWNIGSELRAGLRGGVFFPNTSEAAFGSDAAMRYLVSLDLTLKL